MLAKRDQVGSVHAQLTTVLPRVKGSKAPKDPVSAFHSNPMGRSDVALKPSTPSIQIPMPGNTPLIFTI